MDSVRLNDDRSHHNINQAVNRDRPAGDIHISRETLANLPIMTFLIGLLGIWWLTLPQIDMRQVTDYGIMSILPIPFILAVVGVNLSFCLSLLLRKTPGYVLLLHLVVLIVMVHGTLPLLYDAPRYSWVYKHLGVIEYIEHHGSINTQIDAYHNWPGFFSSFALFNQIAGIDKMFAYINFLTPLIHLVHIAPLYLIYSACTDDRRLVWFAVWIFILADWVGQDYFAPQALGYFLYLTILALLLTAFRHRTALSDMAIWRWPIVNRTTGLFKRVEGWFDGLFSRWRLTRFAVSVKDNAFHSAASEQPTERAFSYRQYGLMALVIAMAAVSIVPSHQLTPFMVFAVIAALALAQRIRLRTLPMLLIIVSLAWMGFMASDFLTQNQEWHSDAGSVAENTDNLVDLSEVSEGRSFVATTSRAITAGVWLIALFGAFRRFINGYWDLTIGLITAAVFPVVVAQSYGGEILFRLYLFSLPGMAFFAAAFALTTPKSSRTYIGRGLAIAMSIGILFLLSYAHFGNERMNYFTENELAATQYLYETAPGDSLFLAASFTVPLSYERNYYWFYNANLTSQYSWRVNSRIFQKQAASEEQVEEVRRILSDTSHPIVYLVLGRSQQEHMELQSVIPIGWMEEFEVMLQESGYFEIIFENEDARIYVRNTRYARLNGLDLPPPNMR